MDLHHLSYFVEVAKQKSFTKAAQKLHLTQPTMSKMIADLEKELGVLLFYRKGKHVEMTDGGYAVFAQANKILESVQDLRLRLEDVRHLKVGSIRIGLPPTIGASFFPKVIADFHQRFPAVSVHLMEVGAKAVEQGVKDGSLNIGVTVLPTLEKEFHEFPFFSEDLVLLVNKNHKLASRHEVHLIELYQESFILFREDFVLHDRVIESCQRVGFIPEIVCKSSQWDFIGNMVNANLGIALLPKTLCDKLQLQNICFIPRIVPTIPWHLGLVWKKDSYIPLATQELIQLTKTMLVD